MGQETISRKKGELRHEDCSLVVAEDCYMLLDSIPMMRLKLQGSEARKAWPDPGVSRPPLSLFCPIEFAKPT